MYIRTKIHTLQTEAGKDPDLPPHRMSSRGSPRVDQLCIHPSCFAREILTRPDDSWPRRTAWSRCAYGRAGRKLLSVRAVYFPICSVWPCRWCPDLLRARRLIRFNPSSARSVRRRLLRSHRQPTSSCQEEASRTSSSFSSPSSYLIQPLFPLKLVGKSFFRSDDYWLKETESSDEW